MSTLEEVVAAFELWRSQRASRTEPIPDRLWAMTKGLVPYYKKVQIQRALKLSGTQFNKYCMPNEEQENSAAAKQGFAVGSVLPQQSVSAQECELMLQGVYKRLQIKLNIQHLPSILSLVERYL